MIDRRGFLRFLALSPLGALPAAAASFRDAGAWAVPPLARVHAGEMIAEGRFHFAPTVSAIDATGVQAFLASYTPQFAVAIGAHNQPGRGA